MMYAGQFNYTTRYSLIGNFKWRAQPQVEKWVDLKKVAVNVKYLYLTYNGKQKV